MLRIGGAFVAVILFACVSYYNLNLSGHVTPLQKWATLIGVGSLAVYTVVATIVMLFRPDSRK